MFITSRFLSLLEFLVAFKTCKILSHYDQDGLLGLIIPIMNPIKGLFSYSRVYSKPQKVGNRFKNKIVQGDSLYLILLGIEAIEFHQLFGFYHKNAHLLGQGVDLVSIVQTSAVQEQPLPEARGQVVQPLQVLPSLLRSNPPPAPKKKKKTHTHTLFSVL